MDKIFENFHGYIHEADCEGVFYGGSFDVVSSLDYTKILSCVEL